jgi:hypothetical protein
MADPLSIPGLEVINQLATGASWQAWINLGISFIVSTLIGGLVLLVILSVLSKAWNEPIRAANAFLVVLVINIINMPIIYGLLGPIIAFIPFSAIVFPLVVWIVLIKLFFKDMKALHAVVTGIIGWVVTMMFVTSLVVMVMGMIGF